MVLSYDHHHHDEEGVWNAFTGLLTRRSGEHWIYCHYAPCTLHCHYELHGLPCTAACSITLAQCSSTIYNASARHRHGSGLKVFWFEWHEKLSGLFCRTAPNSLYNLTLPLTNELRDELSWAEDWLYNASCTAGLECWKRVTKNFSVGLFLAVQPTAQ